MKIDKIIFNGKIITVNENQPRAEAVAISGDRFSAVGSDQEILALADSNTEKIDLQGKTVLPGFNDSHLHLLWIGKGLEEVNLNGVKSCQEIINRGKEFLEENKNLFGAKQDIWLAGRGWNDSLFTDSSLPSRADLDQISTELPIVFRRVCGHVSVVNSKALELAGIDSNFEQPQGGKIDFDQSGKPTGILREQAMQLVNKLQPVESVEDYMRYFEKGQAVALQYGLTSVHSDILGEVATVGPKLTALANLIKKDALPLRISTQIRVWSKEEIDHFKEIWQNFDFAEHTVEAGLIKIMTDGSLGGRTAAMLEPYADDPNSTGVEQLTQKEVNDLLTYAHQAGFQVAGHAIGDKAIQMMLNGFKEMAGSKIEDDLRPRIIHAQITNKELLEEMARLGVVCDIQPVFVGTDLHIVEDRLGKERAKETYAWKTMRKMGIVTAGGSDAPVESCNPLLGIYTAVTRQDQAGYPAEGWLPEEKLSLEEAIELFTLGSAYASFDEKEKGSIETNKLADFVVLAADITSIPVEEIKDLNVESTFVGGKEVYCSK